MSVFCQLSERHASIQSCPNSARPSESSASCFNTAEANVHGFSQSRNAIAALMSSDLAMMRKRTINRRRYHDGRLHSGGLKDRFMSKTALHKWPKSAISGRSGSPAQSAHPLAARRIIAQVTLLSRYYAGSYSDRPSEKNLSAAPRLHRSGCFDEIAGRIDRTTALPARRCRRATSLSYRP